jgi:CcmD family protein
MMVRVRSALRALLLGLALTSGALAAAPASFAHADDAAQDRAQTFEAVTGAVKEDVPGGPLLVAAYALIWLAVFGYLFRLVRMQRNSDENLARLQQDLQKAAQRSQTPK